MEASSQFLPPEIEAAVETGRGGALEATPEELADSAAAIKRSLVQAAAGQTRDVDEAFDDLEARYGV